LLQRSHEEETARGFGQAQQPFIAQRQMQTQSAIANAQSRASIFGAGLGLLGALIMSDSRVKMDARPIGHEILSGVPLYQFKYIFNPDQDYIGPMAEDVLAVAPEAVVEDEQGYLWLNMDMLRDLAEEHSLRIGLIRPEPDEDVVEPILPRPSADVIELSR
jgi:hypothetical protein